MPQIEHPIDGAEQRVQIMGGKQDGDASALLDLPDQRDDLLLEMRIEADQRLVEQQQLWLSEQGLGEQQPLEFATRKFAQGPVSEVLRGDGFERLVDLPPAVASGQRQPPTLAVQGAGHEIPAAQWQVRNGGALLGQISGGAIAAPRLCPEDPDLAGGGRQQTQDGLQQCGLAGAVRTEDRDELAGPYCNADIG